MEVGQAATSWPMEDSKEEQIEESMLKQALGFFNLLS